MAVLAGNLYRRPSVLVFLIRVCVYIQELLENFSASLHGSNAHDVFVMSDGPGIAGDQL